MGWGSYDFFYTGAFEDVTIGQGVTYTLTNDFVDTDYTSFASLVGAIDNAGQVAVGSGSVFAIDGSVTLTGGGEVALSGGTVRGAKTYFNMYYGGIPQDLSDPDQLDNVDNTIEGYGSLNGRRHQRERRRHRRRGGGLGVSGTIANHGLMEANNGGDLALSGAIANAGAAIEALDGSAVTIAGGSITGGVLAAAGTGTVNFEAAMLDGVTLSGGTFQGVATRAEWVGGAIYFFYTGAFEDVTIGQGATYTLTNDFVRH